MRCFGTAMHSSIWVSGGAPRPSPPGHCPPVRAGLRDARVAVASLLGTYALVAILLGKVRVAVPQGGFMQEAPKSAELSYEHRRSFLDAYARSGASTGGLSSEPVHTMDTLELEWLALAREEAVR